MPQRPQTDAPAEPGALAAFFHKRGPLRTGLRRCGQYPVYLLFAGFQGLLGLVPISACYYIGRFLGLLAYYVDVKHRGVALKNMRTAFGGTKPDSECRKLARRAFVSIGGNLLCSVKMPLMSKEDIRACVTVEGAELAAAAAAEGRGMIACIPHMGNWEILSQLPEVMPEGLARGALYQALGNPFLDRHVKAQREQLGYTLFDRKDGFSEPTRFLREGKGGTFGILVDQHAGDSGLWSPFFGRLASTTSLPALIALRTGAPLVPLSVIGDGPARWKVIYGEPVELPGGGKGKAARDPLALTTELNRRTEAMVMRSPVDWFWVHNRWKTPNPNFLLDGYRRGVRLPPGMAADELQRFRILVRSPNWLGDACMAIPAVQAIKRGRPDAHITVLTPTKWAALWERVPEVDALLEKDEGTFPRQVRSAIRALPQRFDAAFLMPNSLRSALEVSRCGIGRVVGFGGHWRRLLLDPVVPPPDPELPPPHHAAKYLLLAKEAGAKIDSSYPGPYLSPPSGAAAAASGRPARRRLGLCPGAEYGPAKRLPAATFADAAHLVCERVPDVEWVLFGTAADAPAARIISAALGDRCKDLVGKTDLRGLIAGLESCEVLLTNDTGTMHLAAVAGVPTVAVFGSTEQALTGPLGDGHTIVRHHLPCSPCFLRECPYGHYDCLRGITADELADAIVTKVGARPAA